MSVTITAASAAIEESVWLIEINPDPQGVGDPRPPQLFMPSGTPMGALNTQGSSVATAPTIVASDRGWVQEPGDTGTIAVYPPRMLEPPAVERFIPVYPGEGRRAQIESGELRFSNTDGALDTIAGEWAVAGRRVKLTRAPHRRPTHAPRSTWVEVASLRASEAFEGTDTCVCLCVRLLLTYRPPPIPFTQARAGRKAASASKAYLSLGFLALCGTCSLFS